MAGNGPAPKPKEQRRNRAEKQRGEWVDLLPLKKEILKPLPEDEEWPPSTRAAWDAWRRDPVSAQWSESDISYARDTIRLHAAMTPTTASEVRLRMDALGLTPKGKRDLRWRIKSEVDGGEAKPPTTRKRGDHDGRRARLTAVK